jgi:hypothetical protein
MHDQDKADQFVKRLAGMRRANQYVESVRGLLAPDDRAGPLARELEAVFTVWTNLRGVDPRFAPATVLRNLPGLQQGGAELLLRARKSNIHAELSPFVTHFEQLLQTSRPIYRVRAEAKVEGVIARREALLVHNSATRVVRVVLWRDVID